MKKKRLKIKRPYIKQWFEQDGISREKYDEIVNSINTANLFELLVVMKCAHPSHPAFKSGTGILKLIKERMEKLGPVTNDLERSVMLFVNSEEFIQKNKEEHTEKKKDNKKNQRAIW